MSEMCRLVRLQIDQLDRLYNITCSSGTCSHDMKIRKRNYLHVSVIQSSAADNEPSVLYKADCVVVGFFRRCTVTRTVLS